MPDAETDLILKSNIKHSVSIQGPNTKIYIYIYIENLNLKKLTVYVRGLLHKSL